MWCFEISHLRSPNHFKVALCYQPWYVQLGFFCLFSCLWRSHFTSPDPSACLFWEQEVYLRTLMVKHTSHVGYMYVALASFPGHVGGSAWTSLIPIPLGRQCMSQPHSHTTWEPVYEPTSFPYHLGGSVWANLIPRPCGRQCMSHVGSQNAAVYALQQLHWW